MKFAASIRFRLAAWYAAFLSATFLALGFGVWAAVQKSVYDIVDAELSTRTNAARQFLDRMPHEVSGVREELGEQSAFSSSGTTVRLLGDDGRWIFLSPGASEEPFRMARTGQPANLNMGGKHVRAMQTRLAVGTLEIGILMDGYEKVMGRIALTMILGSPLALLLASAGGYWMSRRALAPVDRIASMAREISVQNLSKRLPVRATGDELDRLSDTLNSMFERLESAFRRITQFTADASHELRTPLAIIQTTAELTTNRPRSQEEHLSAWNAVLAESARTTKLLEDLMTLARADSHSDGIERRPVDFASCVREATHQVRSLAEVAGLRMRVAAREAVTISGDSEALQRLCLILLDNAIKYTPRGGEIRVSLSSTDEQAILEIGDSGIGISAEDQIHVFDRFYRAAKDRSRRTGGAGLGLAIAQQITLRHGGSIGVESVIGKGSTFRTTFPLLLVAPRASGQILPVV